MVWINYWIEQELSVSSDITYNETLAKSIIALFDVSELRTNGNEYVVRKYIRSILKTYVSEINKVRRIIVKDKAKFGIQMETMVLNIGFSSESSSRQFLPDDNVLVLSVLVLAIIILTTNTRNNWIFSRPYNINYFNGLFNNMFLAYFRCLVIAVLYQ